MNLKVWSNGCEYLVAESEQEAKQMLTELSGVEGEELEGDGWNFFDDDELLSIRMEQGDWECFVASPARAWCRAGKRYLASTEC